MSSSKNLKSIDQLVRRVDASEVDGRFRPIRTSDVGPAVLTSKLRVGLSMCTVPRSYDKSPQVERRLKSRNENSEFLQCLNIRFSAPVDGKLEDLDDAVLAMSLSCVGVTSCTVTSSWHYGFMVLPIKIDIKSSITTTRREEKTRMNLFTFEQVS